MLKAEDLKKGHFYKFTANQYNDYGEDGIGTNYYGEFDRLENDGRVRAIYCFFSRENTPLNEEDFELSSCSTWLPEEGYDIYLIK